MKLREYQVEALNAVFNAFRSGSKAPLVIAPTGAGKSIIIAEFIRKMRRNWPHTRIIQLVDTRELVKQNADTFKRLCPQEDVGIYSAGLNSRDLKNHVIFAGIQSIYQKAFFLGKIDVVIIDEAHKLPRDAQTRYGKFLKDVRIANPNVVLLGLTATPYRLDSGVLCDGDDALFDCIAYDIEVQRLVDEGYLAPLISKGGVKKIDLTNVRTRAGDYATNDLAAAADAPEIVEAAVKEMVAYGADRRAWLVFAAGVENAYHICERLKAYDIPAGVVEGDMSNGDRDEVIRQFKSGELRAVVNVGVLTTGFDYPAIDMIALLTATKSASKFVQMCGRGTRVCEGKSNGLVLDFGGNVIRHGPFDAVNGSIMGKTWGKTETEKPKKQPMKECPQCYAILPIQTKQCDYCEYEFPPSSCVDPTAYDGAMMLDQEPPKWITVCDIDYKRWEGKNGKPDTLRIDFFGDLTNKPYPIWLCLNHTGYAKTKALEYVKAARGRATNLEDALKERMLWDVPEEIKIQRDPKNPKYWRVTGFKFPEFPDADKVKPGQVTLS